MKKLLNLCLVIKDGKILLGMKKRGFGAGRWNGYGGKVEPGENMLQSAVREIGEEACISVKEKDLEQVAILDFKFESGSEPLEVHVFTISEFEGEPVETEEMKPEWFDFDKVPYGEMWPDDQYWLPLVLMDGKLQGEFTFDAPSTQEYTSVIKSHHIREVMRL